MWLIVDRHSDLKEGVLYYAFQVAVSTQELYDINGCQLFDKYGQLIVTSACWLNKRRHVDYVFCGLIPFQILSTIDTQNTTARWLMG